MARWLSIPNGGLGETGLKDLATSFKDRKLLPSLVRESVQNSLDAKRSDVDKVLMEFCYQKINPYEIPENLRLRQIFSYCAQFVVSESEKGFFNQGVETLDGSSGEKTLGILRISDHGTVGLTGLGSYSENGRFRGLVTRMGMGNDDAARGGNFGVGKQALFIASKIRTVFFSSIDSESGLAGHMGVSKLSSFRDKELGIGKDGKALCADRTVYYCNESYDPVHQSGNPVIGEQFKFANRAVGDFGTDVFIVGFDPEEGKLSEKILAVLLSEFIVAVAEGCLEVTLPDGFTLSRESLDKAFSKFRNGSPSQTEFRKIESYVKLIKRPWKSSPIWSVGSDMPEFPAGAIEYKFVKSEEDNFCRVTREKGMFVHTVKKVCGNANCVGIAVIRDKGLSASFKGMENEAHDGFKVTDTRFQDMAQRTLAEAQLKALEDSLRKCANDEMGAKIDAKMVAVLPDEMDELMNICAGQISVVGVKEKNVNRSVKLGGARIKRIRRKPKTAVQAEAAGLVEGEDPDAQSEPGVIHTGMRANNRTRASSGGKRHFNAASPEANGFVLRTLNIEPFVYASSSARSGRYKVAFTVPRNRMKICLCFSATTEADSQERLNVMSVSATDASGNQIPAAVDLAGTAVSFENVTKGQKITAEVQFDISYYCYSQVRYYEKKNN